MISESQSQCYILVQEEREEREGRERPFSMKSTVSEKSRKSRKSAHMQECLTNFKVVLQQ